MKGPCACLAIGAGKQLFRVPDAERTFREVRDVGPLHDKMIGGRRVWACRECGRLFALLRLIYKDEEEILVRPAGQVPEVWDWSELAEQADRCRWTGPGGDPRRLP